MKALIFGATIFLSILGTLASAESSSLEGKLMDTFSSVDSKLVAWEIFATCSPEVTLGRLKYLIDDIEATEESDRLPVQLRYDEFVFNRATEEVTFLSEDWPSGFDPFLEIVAECSFDTRTNQWPCRATALDPTPYKTLSDLPPPEIKCP